MQTLDEIIRALRITEDTVLFVDVDQINLKALADHKGLPKDLLIVGVKGRPNVEVFTKSELQLILGTKA